MTKNYIEKVQEAKKEVMERNMKDVVLTKITQLQGDGQLEIPEGYSASNALQSAWLIFEDNEKLKNGSQVSIANSLLKMVALGLDPAKKQGYFIPYGSTVQFQESYHGNIHILKRDAGAKSVTAQVVYEGDNFEYEIEPSTGKVKVAKHTQTLDSVDSKKPRAAYAVIVFDDESLNHTEIMTFEQIKQAWLQSSMLKDEEAIKRSKTHNKFQEEMVKKTVINRAAKRFISTTSVSMNKTVVQEINQEMRKHVYDAEIKKEQGNTQIDFDETTPEEVEFKEVPENVNEETGEILETPTNERSSVMDQFETIDRMEDAPF